MRIVPILLIAVLTPLAAQEIKMPASLDKLAAKADETVDVTLDGPLLKLVGKFLSSEGEDQPARKILSGLQSITVKSYEFSSEGQYDPADLEEIRAQVKAPAWSRIVGVRSKKDRENVDVYFKDGGNGNLGGIVVLCAEPRELTIVSVVGTIDPSQLASLGGQFGIPRFDFEIGATWRDAK
ncbi:MAG TPA: DUF4252 domain-containing protein [Verrucomicrobiae bacterium]|nr:DUF4252 domain-containing protein [Verrucomicrobiae bacterium]